MRRNAKTRSELMAILNQCLDNNPECGECELHAVRMHQPDHTGCNWSAEVDFPERTEADAVRNLRQARRVVTLVRERYNVMAGT